MHKCRSIAVVMASAATLAAAQPGPQPQPRLPQADLTVGIHRIKAELAVSPEQQATGMMFRTAMGANEGMLFVNAESSIRCFWMRNTLLPLAIAFIADDGSIVNIAEMQPQSDQSHCSTKPARYALEMNQGWFKKRGVKPGDQLRGGPLGKP